MSRSTKGIYRHRIGTQLILEVAVKLVRERMTESSQIAKSRPVVPHGGVFDRVITLPVAQDSTQVTWWLTPSFVKRIKTTPVFQLQWAETAEAAFVDVGSTTESTTATDTERRTYSKESFSVYRIKLVMGDSTYYSDPVAVTGRLNRHNYLLAKEIVRREFVLLTRYTGISGDYYARRQWGTPCTACLDFNTGEPTNQHCTTCKGTGLVSGYHAPVTMIVGTALQDPHRVTRDENKGILHDTMMNVRAVAAPSVTTGDVWRCTDTGEFWSIQTHKDIAVIKGVPIVKELELKLIEPDNEVYSLFGDSTLE